MTIKKTVPMLLLVLFLACGPALAAEAEESEMLNINSATAAQLMEAVPGLSGDLAQGIVSYREDMGDIQDLNELLEVKGMTRDMLEQLKKNVGLGEFLGSECSC